MVHVGRLYKLQFRRDLAIVDNNVNAWAESYRINPFPFVGTKGVHLATQTWDVVNTEELDQPPMPWVSDDLVISGEHYQITMQIDEPYDRTSGTFNGNVRLVSSGDGEVMRFDFKSALGFYRQFMLRWDPASLHFAHGYDFGPFVFQVAVGARLWADYNP